MTGQVVLECCARSEDEAIGRHAASLGFEPLPQSFWERSMLTRPADREVVCHASAWDVTFAGDLRVKMCIKPTEEDLVTIHHELGHNFYQRAYNTLAPLYQNGANDGFHEAIGDAMFEAIPDCLRLTLPGGHALPLEQPAEVAAALTTFVHDLDP